MKVLTKGGDILLLALQSLTVHLVRSLLTSLSVIIGVACVIANLAINAGAGHEAQRFLRELGSDNIIINAVKPPTEAAQGRGGFAPIVYGISFDDVKRFQELPDIRKCVTVHRRKQYIYAKGTQTSASVIATEPTYSDVTRIDMLAGRFISHADIMRRTAFCVITHSLARELFKFEDPLGQVVRIGNSEFRVVGVLRQLPSALAGGEEEGDNQIIIPLSSGRSYFGELALLPSAGSFTAEKVDVSQVILQMKDEQAVVEAAAVCRQLLERYHTKKDYQIRVPIEEIEMQKKQRRLWNVVMLVIAGVSLLVGGIGIMNIMLASVTERTREIGVRRALGAKRRDITVQFLVEAITLTALGGLLGICVGLPIPWIVQWTLGFKGILTASMLWVPFLVAVSVGLLSGMYPAIRASRLDPIEALRHE